MSEVTESIENVPGSRFAKIFKALMVFCVLVWLWGLGLIMLWPWQAGGEWLPEFPIVSVCADNSVCAIPYGELVQAKSAGKIKSLIPSSDTGEMPYGMITLQWKLLSGGIEAKASAWNFQTTVRYRLENDMPVLVEYQEIGGRLFQVALIGALVTLIGLYLNKARR